MSVVYITNASMKHIVRSLRNKKYISRDDIIKNIANDFIEDDFITADDLDTFLSTIEMKDIYIRKMVLKDFEALLKTINENQNNIDTFVKNANDQYVYKIKEPAYHLNQNCNWMNQSFHNIRIPEECLTDLHTKEKFNSWINDQKNISFEELNIKFKKEFNCPKGLKEINLKNSGRAKIDNYNIELNLHEEIKKKRLQLRFLLNEDIGKKIRNYRYAPKFKIDGMIENENNKPIKDFHSAKDELQKLLYNFYQKKYNIDLSFKSHVLDSIGFRLCRGCSM